MSSSNIDTIGQSNEGSTALSNTLSPSKPEVDDDNYDDDPQAFSLIRFFGVCYVFRSKSRCNGKVNVGSVAATLAIPLIFMGEYGFTRGVAELPYLSMLVDIFIGSFVCTLFEKRFNKAMAKNNGKPIPEERLSPMIFGSIFFAIGLFLLAWSGSYPEHVHWIVPTIGSSFIGFGLITIFLPCMNYIIDCYLMFAASAMAANTFLRSMFGGAFPLFARQMFVNMKIQWVGILLGCVSVVLLPVPFLFYSYGRKIREK